MSDPTEPTGKRGLFAELQRRNVFRAAAIYIAAAWALSQGIAQLAPVFHAPDWVARWFIIACIIGFPFWIAFSWFFQITPNGLKLDSEVHAGESISRRTGRKLDFWIIGVLVVAVVLLITNQFVLRNDATSVTNSARMKAALATLAKVLDKSVAVLPLKNESGDPKQRYFSDGLSEELISDLTQINGLKVIGKFSSFKFRDSKDNPAEIGAALGVAHLILGSVRQQGDRIRVTVNMIRAQDGSSVWSETYNDQLKDVFAIQSKIGKAVASALKLRLLGSAIVAGIRPPGGNMTAYKLMLQGHAMVQLQTKEGFEKGIALLQQALELDPKYAYAWGLLSTALINQGQLVLGGDARQEAYANARVAAGKQQVLAPDAATTHMDRGYLLANVEKNQAAAMAEYRKGLKLAPHDGRALAYLAYGLTTSGQLKEAAALWERAVSTDPQRVGWTAALASTLLADRQLDGAEKASRTVLALQPGFPGMYANLAQIAILRGEPKLAVREAAKEPNDGLAPWVQAMAQQINPDRRKADAALHNYIAQYGKTQPYFVADLYAVRKQPDAMFKWLERAWKQHDPNFTILYDVFPLAYKDDPRFAKLCKTAGLPVPGETIPGAASSAG